MNPAKIAIAGAGVGGLTLAVALHRQGYEVQVFERRARMGDGGTGISLWPNALAALDTIGLGDQIRSLGCSLSSGGMLAMDGHPAATFDSDHFRSALGEDLVCVDRGQLIRALSSHLNPENIRSDTAVLSYELTGEASGGQASDPGSGGRVRLGLSDGSSATVDGLVAADGIGSVLATQMAGRLATVYSGYTAWRAVAETHSDDTPSEMWACFARGHEVGWLPVGRHRTYWFATACLPRDYHLPDGDRFYLAAEFRDWPAPIPTLIASTDPGRLLRNDIIDRAVAKKWADGPVALLGDAAHPMRPHLGQGGCQAIEDAATLALCLADQPDIAGAFARYEQLRRGRASRIVRRSRRVRFTRPVGVGTRSLDRVSKSIPNLGVGPAMRMLAPIAGYHSSSAVPKGRGGSAGPTGRGGSAGPKGRGGSAGPTGRDGSAGPKKVN